MREGLTRREALATAGVAAGAAALGGRTAASLAASDPVRGLRRVVRGPVVRPQNSASLVYDLRYSRVRPAAIVQPLDSRDVAAAVKHCASKDIRMTARSGGHSYAGYSTVAGGVVLDLRRLAGVRLSSGQATIGPGTQLIDMYRRLAASGLTVPGGSCPSVCVGGHATGGGMGLAGRKLGLMLDHVVGLTVVTADGRIRQARCRRVALAGKVELRDGVGAEIMSRSPQTRRPLSTATRSARGQRRRQTPQRPCSRARGRTHTTTSASSRKTSPTTARANPNSRAHTLIPRTSHRPPLVGSSP